jgi:hypothetical protein
MKTPAELRLEFELFLCQSKARTDLFECRLRTRSELRDAKDMCVVLAVCLANITLILVAVIPTVGHCS